MEQLNATVKQNADNAQQAHQLVVSASDLAPESLRDLAERAVAMAREAPEDRFAGLLPEVLIGIGLDAFAALAAKALAPKPELELSLHHIHAPTVSVREQAGIVVDRLRRAGTMTFRSLCGDSPDTITTVARFLALLELFRESVIGFDQVTPLGELTVRWTGDDGVDVEDLITDEFEGAPVPEENAADDD